MENNNKKGGLIIILLIIVIIILICGIVFLYFKYDDLEDKYENKYNYNIDETKNNNNEESNENNSSNNDSSNYISKEDALQIALKDLNISKNDIYDLDIELENKYRYGKTVFEVSFDYNHYEYEYYVDPLNGNILDSFKSRD